MTPLTPTRTRTATNAAANATTAAARPRPAAAPLWQRLARPLLAASLALAALPAAWAAETGFRPMTVAGADPIPVALYYPSSAAARTVNLGPWAVRATPGAPADQPLRGLILLSHGTGGMELGHHDLATRLARAGYLVAALRHTHDDHQDRSLVTSGRYFTERPAQASRVLDAVLADPAWAARLPAGRIGALGHSAGGYTVLALAGAQAEPRRAAEHCRNVNDDPGFCRLAQGPRPAAAAAPSASAALAAAPASAPAAAMPAALPPVRDARIRAVAALAPMAVVLTPESLAQVSVPTTIFVAEHDAVLTGRHHGGHAARHIPGAQLSTVAGAGHFAFMSRPLQSIAADAGDPSHDPAGFDRAAFLERLGDELVAWFDGQLR